MFYLFDKANNWLLNDPDPKTQKELKELIASAQTEKAALNELESRFSGFLEFGTAGLRAELGAGESRMNRAVVRRATAGLCDYLLEKNSSPPPVLIVANDARFMSEEFANEVCAVASTKGLKVLQLPSKTPTPLLAFTVKHLAADAGVMITASHNPPRDNGYKVYDHFGAGIISPVDKEILFHINNQPAVISIDPKQNWQQIDTRVEYLAQLKKLVPKIEDTAMKIAYTPMHGVGRDLFMSAVKNLNLTNVFIVNEQSDPDPTFKTVEFPNPEEPGATDLLMALAQNVEAELAIAHDPDADRCAVGVKNKNDWQLLSGDELGILLAWWIMQKTNTEKNSVFSATIVSSGLVPKMAKQLGFSGQTTLTGMKWAGHIENLVFGYEEAIGYCVDPAAVRDKDGISAALIVIQLMDWAKRQNKSFFTILDEIYEEFGLHLTKQVSVRLREVNTAKEKLREIIADPPKQIADENVTAVYDMSNGFEGLAGASGIYLQLDQARVIIRPSGTEPKIKCYLEVSGDNKNRPTVEKRLTNLANAMQGYLA